MEKQFYSKLAGVTGDNEDGRSRQSLIRKFASKEEVLILEREPDNSYDLNAIAAYVIPLDDPWGEDQYKVGFLSSKVAAELAPLMDSGYQVVCSVTDVTGGEEGKESIGVNILLTIFTPEEVEARRRDREAEAAQAAARKPPGIVQEPNPVTAPVKTTIKKRRSIWFYGILAGLVIGSLASIGHLLKPDGSQDIVLNFISNVIVYTLFATAGLSVFRKFIRL